MFEPVAEPPEVTRPPEGEVVIAYCRGFKCLAYGDAEGRWRDAFQDQELPEVLAFRRWAEQSALRPSTSGPVAR